MQAQSGKEAEDKGSDHGRKDGKREFCKSKAALCADLQKMKSGVTITG